jgi:ABC-type lipoprotein release transport system permease subunit
VASCTATLIWVEALTIGMLDDSIAGVTRVATGDAQVHAAGWTVDRSIYGIVPEASTILSAVRRAGGDGAARAYGVGLVACGSKSAGAVWWGVDPVDEARVFRLAGKVAVGTFLGGGSAHGLVLGAKLARSLHAVPGSEIVAVVQAADGSTGNDLFVVEGVLAPVDAETDRTAAIVRRSAFAALFATAEVHEVALSTRGRMTPAALVHVARAAAAKGRDVRTWRELLPMFASLVDLSGAQLWLLGAVFFLAAGLGVTNTMLMATWERTREFGVQLALGALPTRIVREVATEALLLGVTGALVGLVAGLAGGWWLSRTGIDVSHWVPNGIDVGGVTMEPVMRGALTVRGVVVPFLGGIGTCVVASLWPAIRVGRMDPVTAMGAT